jgi:hypothetical protein
VFGTATPATQKKLTDALGRVIDLRARLHADAELGARWLAVKHFQSERLARTYSDLLASDRYRESCEFFLEELYGARDFEQRDAEAQKVVPKLARMLPARAIETLLLAVELDELAEDLDAGVAGLVRTPVSVQRYAEAYREVGSEEQREHQIELVHEIGRALDRLARIPMLAPMLGMMKGPADAWGYGHLHHFLYRGFHAFAAMGGAGEFLGTIKRRELVINTRLFAGDPDPFRPVD